MRTREVIFLSVEIRSFSIQSLALGVFAVVKYMNEIFVKCEYKLRTDKYFMKVQVE